MDKYKIRQVVLLPNKILKNLVSEMKRNFSKLSLHKNINDYSYKMFLHFAKKIRCCTLSHAKNTRTVNRK
jgi:hypothetical protein